MLTLGKRGSVRIRTTVGLATVRREVDRGKGGGMAMGTCPGLGRLFRAYRGKALTRCKRLRRAVDPRILGSVAS